MYGQYGMNANLGGYGSTYGQGINYGGSAANGLDASNGSSAAQSGGYGGAAGVGRAAPGVGAAAGGEYGSALGGSSYSGVGGNARGQTQHEFVEGKLFLGGLPGQTTKHKEHVIDSKRVEAKAAVRSADGNNNLTRKMFVGGTGEVRDEDFRTYFEQFGDIEDCVVLRSPDGKSRGFGFVTYSDEIAVEKCLVMRHMLNGKQVELKRALSRDRPSGGGGAYSQQGGYGGGFGGSYGAGGGGGGPVRSGKQPDWVCSSADCKNKNFGWRTNCNRCQLPKPANPELAPARPSGGAAAPYGSARPSYDAGQTNGAAANGGYGAGGAAQAYGSANTSQGYGAMGMQGMGAYGMGAFSMGALGGMAALGASGLGSYGASGGGYGQAGEGYGRAGSGRGAGSQNRYRPY